MTPALRRRVITITAALGGLLLFAYAIERVGIEDIAASIRRVGWGLVPIVALGGIRFAIRAEAWRSCTPAGARLRFPEALIAFLAGDAVGNLTPLGLLASEPTKVFLTRHHLATRESVASLAIDNVVYAASVLAMIAAGTVVLLSRVRMPFALQEGAIGALIVVAAIGIAGALALRGSWDPERGQRPEWRERLATIRMTVLEFSAGQPRRLWRIFALDALFHVVAVYETYLTLGWLVGGTTVTDAIVFESLNRVTTAVFKFVPFRVGVDEAVSGAFSPVLQLNPLAGVALALVRKVRNLFWTGIGLALIGAHHARGAPAMDHQESVPAHRT